MTIWRAAIFAALFFMTLPGRGLAQDVTLTARDGSVVLDGTLISFDGEFYRIETEYGLLTVDGSGVVCDGPGCPDLGAFAADIGISGARTMGEVLMPALVESFARGKGYGIERQISDDSHFTYVLTDKVIGRVAARLRFRISSTAEGFADLLADEADLVLAMRPPSREEVRLAREAGQGDLTNPRRSRIVALDALVPVVARRNPVPAMTPETLARVFAGDINNWQALGGPDAPIALHLRDDGSGLAQEFLSRVLVPARRRLAEGVTLHAGNADLTQAVARDPHAIGIAPLSDPGNARVLALKGLCGMQAGANRLTLKTEEYPLTAPLFIYTPAVRLPVIAREFLSFTRSAPAQRVVQRAGFTDLRVERIPLADQGRRLANAIAGAGAETPLSELQRMVARMQGAARLSLGFRFLPGGTMLDAQSRSNIELLAQALERGEYYTNTLVIAGFSDGEGAAAGNLRLARRRAEAVRRAVLRAAPTADRDRLDLQVDAFGEAMPMACDDSDWGRRINRRVEVWVGPRIEEDDDAG